MQVILDFFVPRRLLECNGLFLFNPSPSEIVDGRTTPLTLASRF